MEIILECVPRIYGGCLDPTIPWLRESGPQNEIWINIWNLLKTYIVKINIVQRVGHFLNNTQQVSFI